MSRFIPRPTRARRLIAATTIIGALATGCSNEPAPVAQPVTTTSAQPRVVTEPETTTTSTSTTTTVAPPPPSVTVSLLGSIRSLPTPGEPGSTSDDDDGDDVDDDDRRAPALDTDDATVASLACTSSTGCEPTDLAAWAANTIDAVNLATNAAAIDGAEVLDEHASALLASGVATIGYGPTIEDALEPAIVGTAERPVAVYAISLAENIDTELIATETTPGIAAGEGAFDLLIEQVRQSQDAGQETVVMMDFGRLDGRAPEPLELEQVQVVVDAGVDAIIGHGSDFLHRFERIAQTTVAFSLGNAITNTEIPLRQDTAVFRFTVAENGSTACLLPATASSSGISIDDPDTVDCP